MQVAHSRHSTSSYLYLGTGALLLLASGTLLGSYFFGSGAGGFAAAEAATPAEASPADISDDAVRAAAQGLLPAPVRLVIGDRETETTWADLGVMVDEDGVGHATEAARQADGDLARGLAATASLPLVLDRDRATQALEELGQAHRSAPSDAWMDLEQRTVHPARPGRSLDVYAAIGVVEEAARAGLEQVTLPMIEVPAAVTVADLGIDNISHVLAQFETKYAATDHIRNFNLKLAASKLNGHVLQPGDEFSFNDVVGPRTEKEGYKIAGVINAGEMVDGLAGGTCQISTTLHGAAFFAGLEIVRALPHSRPSTYVTMGLDATVVYPHIDLKLRNGYDFPVAIHYRVNGGKSMVEILGPERPYDEVVFEREILDKVEFDTITREDDALPLGSMSVDQAGFYGYELKRLRKFYKDGEMVKQDKWKLRYRPVTEYVRTGINLDPNLAPPPPKKKKTKRLKEPDKAVYRISR